MVLNGSGTYVSKIEPAAMCYHLTDAEKLTDQMAGHRVGLKNK
jgi:hypothetical protein